MGQLYKSSAPIGEVKPFAGATPPRGFLLCDGTSYTASLYPRLAQVLWNGSSYTFGGSGTYPTGSFNVPDFRDRFPKGKGSAETLGATGGSNTLLDHTHGVANAYTDITHSHGQVPLLGSTGVDNQPHYHGQNYSTNPPTTMSKWGTNDATGLAVPCGSTMTQAFTVSTTHQVRTDGPSVSHSHSLVGSGATTDTISIGTTNRVLSGYVGSNAAPSSTNNRPAYINLNYIIRAF